MYKLERCEHGGVRKITLNGSIVASALRFTNGRWGIYDTNEEHRLSYLSFSSPGSAKTHYANMNKLESDR